ncbi:DUF885 domain-containing protein [Aliikangiella sp. IMCC44359]|uniref:DUF885 domain-containing protein n=1 Tax=Aliikangiella sp. IMCC44359 TaxID=3459125 RepID=UPI00403A948F
MKNLLLSFGVLFLLGGSFQSQAESSQLHQLFAQEWQARLERSPLMATRHGVKGFDHLLMDVSSTAYQAWAIKTKGFLDKLATINFEELSTEDKINYQIFKQQLERRVKQIEFKSYQIPFLSDSGFHTQMMRLSKSVPLKTTEDYENYLKRLGSIPVFFQQNIDNMRDGLKRDFSMPRVVMNGFSEVIESAYINGWDKSSLWEPLANMPKTISVKKQRQLKANAKKILINKVMPAFKKLHQFFDKVYIPGTRKSLAAHSLPSGRAYYQSQVEHYTTLNLTAEEIHQIGLKEVARIRSEMEQIIKSLNFKGDFKDFLHYLRTEPKFYAKSAEELIKEASYIAKRMDGQLPKLFTRLPRQPYTVEPVPEAMAPKYTTGRYVSAPLKSEQPGIYWVNTYALDKRPLYVLEALTLHEAVPGHHLQGSLNQELDNLPNFRRYSYISAFGEGWGLYSEKLGLEAGFYKDAYSNFGRLTYEMWRAARLVIDTGIHAKGWTREQSINLLEENSALSTHNIRTEVDRYISWPGQALSYKLGELKILELRQRAEKLLGNQFDLRLFHDELLKNGSIPLAVLEQQIDRFIKDSQ